MTHKVYVVTDLGPGDGGKGGVVHAVATMQRAHTVIKRGGAQGSHGVRTSGGESFAFSQWGCGTLEGIPTHISRQMVTSPEGLLNEAEALRCQCGIRDPFSLLSVDEGALIATPYHGIASRLQELARGENPRGTVGTGVGQAYRGLQDLPDLALYARDLSRADLRDRLAAVREYMKLSLEPLNAHLFADGDNLLASQEIGRLYDDEFFEYVVKRFGEAASLANIVSGDYLGDAILSQEGVAIVESSHGVLTDRLAGFSPHTSAIRTLPRFTEAMLAEAGFDSQIVNIGVTRAYAIRHGAGPMPTDDPSLAEHLLPGSSKDENRYQGKVRVGPLDFVLLRYAIAASGGPSVFDGLAITWFDQIKANGSWQTCNSYNGVDDQTYFTSKGELKVGAGDDHDQLLHQAALGRALQRCEPNIALHEIDPSLSDDELYARCAETIEGSLEVPVRMVSFGPTELDKLCR